jgi:hypothetical protein
VQRRKLAHQLEDVGVAGEPGEQDLARRIWRAVTASSGTGRFLAGISRRQGRTADRRAALPADARRRPVRRSDAARPSRCVVAF